MKILDKESWCLDEFWSKRFEKFSSGSFPELNTPRNMMGVFPKKIPKITRKTLCPYSVPNTPPSSRPPPLYPIAPKHRIFFRHLPIPRGGYAKHNQPRDRTKPVQFRNGAYQTTKLCSYRSCPISPALSGQFGQNCGQKLSWYDRTRLWMPLRKLVFGRSFGAFFGDFRVGKSYSELSEHPKSGPFYGFQAIWTSLQWTPLYSEHFLFSPLHVHYRGFTDFQNSDPHASPIPISSLTMCIEMKSFNKVVHHSMW